MTTSTPTTSEDIPAAPDDVNVLGAVLFSSYIIAALLFSGLIIRDIFTLWKTSRHHDALHRDIDRRRCRARAMLASSAALLSFSVLSFNMLNFLLLSFSQWVSAQGWGDGFHLRSRLSLSEPGATSQLKSNLFDARVMSQAIWAWSTQSTLFETFARDLLRDGKTWKWTSCSLIYHYACNVYISMLGHRYRIPHLWAYFVLNQILPISFTQNLFLVTINLVVVKGESKVMETKPHRPARSLRLAALILYLVLLFYLVPGSTKSERFMPVLLLTRIVLFIPFLIDVFCYHGGENGDCGVGLKVSGMNSWCLLVLGLSAMFVVIAPGRTLPGETGIVGTNYAAAALSNDLIVGLGSLILYKAV